MNSMSRKHFPEDCDPCGKKRENFLTILKCGTPGSASLPGVGVTATTTTTTVSSLSVNTSCFCDPCIKLEFASNITVPTTTLSATLTFQVFKLCSNQLTPVPIGPQWVFSRLAALGTTDTFTFFICDCDSCPNECCTYTVQLTASVIAVGLATATTTVAVNNATLSALVEEA